MTTTIDINEQIKVRIHPQPKKKKGDSKIYDIYLHFTISENGIVTITPPALSTGLALSASEWDQKLRQKKGKSGELFNGEIQRKMQAARIHLENFKNANVRSCAQVREEIVTNLKVRLTGKAPRGTKKDLTMRQNENTMEAVLNDLFRVQNQSPERQRIYRHAVGILQQFFNGRMPLITNISEKDLLEFKTWYKSNYRCTHGKRIGKEPANDTTTTWFTMIASVFKHAEKRMKILTSSPIPEKFRGSFANAEKPVLSQKDCLKLINLDESALTASETMAKHCLILQLTTGCGYGDLKNLKMENRRRDPDTQQWQIVKNRNKTGVQFKVYLTPRASDSFDKLRELARGTDTIFKLPSLNYMNRQYRKLVMKAKVSTHVTTYTLRHSFSVDYMNNDGRLEDLGKIIGNDIRNTKIYGRISDLRLAQKTNQLVQKSRMHQL